MKSIKLKNTILLGLIGILVSLIIFVAFFFYQNNEIISNKEDSIDTIQESKKILFVNSYHKGYEWSDGIEKGLTEVLQKHPEIEVKFYRMNTKLNTSDSFKKQAALEAKQIIEDWQPDIVVTSDDNASKYLISPYYRNTNIPFVFCGVNAEISTYGFPASNITGMIEVTPTINTINMLKQYANGNRMGYIGANTPSNQDIVNNYQNVLKLSFSGGKLINNFTEWKKEYLKLQNSVDLILWLNPIGIDQWNEEEGITFIYNNTKIPLGSTADIDSHYTLLGSVKIAEEQGEWSARTALKILDGISPSEIPVTANKNAGIYLNMKLAKKMGIKFPVELIENAHLISDVK